MTVNNTFKNTIQRKKSYLQFLDSNVYRLIRCRLLLAIQITINLLFLRDKSFTYKIAFNTLSKYFQKRKPTINKTKTLIKIIDSQIIIIGTKEQMFNRVAVSQYEYFFHSNIFIFPQVSLIIFILKIFHQINQFEQTFNRFLSKQYYDKQLYYQLACQMDETILTLDDINSFIKAYAYWIQIRLEEIQIWHHRSTNQNNKSDLPYENGDNIVTKFSNYFTQKQLEIKLIKKFSERIIQIFQFFKTKSKNQNLLAIIEKKITNKLEILVNQIPLNVEEIFLLAQSLMKKGAMLKSSFQRVQTASRASSRQKTFRSMKRTSTDKLIKVQTVSICQQHPSYSLIPINTTQEANISKNGTTFIRTFSRSQINRPKSVVNIGKRGQNTSIHKKDHNANTFQNKSNSIQLDKLYAGMNIDKNYITKSIQRSCFMMKDSLKRNSKLINKLTHANKKRIKTLTDQHDDTQINRNILAQWNFKTSKLNVCTNSGIKSYVNRKRKYIGHMIAQKKLNKKLSEAKQNFPVQEMENS